MAKWVYLFSEGNANMRNLLGGKGHKQRSCSRLDPPPSCQNTDHRGQYQSGKNTRDLSGI